MLGGVDPCWVPAHPLAQPRPKTHPLPSAFVMPNLNDIKTENGGEKGERRRGKAEIANAESRNAESRESPSTFESALSKCQLCLWIRVPPPAASAILQPA